MYKRFNWIVTMILSVVTCGLYSMYVWYKMSKEQNDMAEKILNCSFLLELEEEQTSLID